MGIADMSASALLTTARILIAMEPAMQLARDEGWVVNLGVEWVQGDDKINVSFSAPPRPKPSEPET